MSHDKYFYGKKLYVILALHSIYQKQKTESVYLFLKNNYGSFSETHIFFKDFLNRNNKNNDVSIYMPPFWIFFYETKDNMLVFIYDYLLFKFEVNNCCGWDFRQGVGVNISPPMHKRYHIDTPCTIGLTLFIPGVCT